jgi:hypothetical protein
VRRGGRFYLDRGGKTAEEAIVQGVRLVPHEPGPALVQIVLCVACCRVLCGVLSFMLRVWL